MPLAPLDMAALELSDSVDFTTTTSFSIFFAQQGFASEKMMEDAATEIHDLQKMPSNEVVDCAVSCDGTWQRRGF